MKEPGEGLLHGVRLVPPGTVPTAGTRTITGGMMTLDDAACALAALCIAVRHTRLRAAWGLSTGDAPKLEVVGNARPKGELADHLARLLFTVRRDLPEVNVITAGSDGERGERDKCAEPPRDQSCDRGDGDALSAAELDMLLDRGDCANRGARRE